MLAIELIVIDGHGRKKIATIRAVRGEAHAKMPNHFTYSYGVQIDGVTYEGEVLHGYDNGAVALTQKITKNIVDQQKAARAAAKDAAK